MRPLCNFVACCSGLSDNAASALLTPFQGLFPSGYMPYKPVSALIQSLFMRSVMGAKLHVGFQRPDDFLVLTELQTVIEGYRVTHILVVAQQ